MADPTDEGQESDDHTESSVIKDLRAKAKRVDQAEARAQELERQLALSQAGLSGLNDKQVKALLAAHEGDLTGDGLKATATEIGLAKVEAGTPDPEPDPAADEAAEIARLSGGEPADDRGSGGRVAFERELAEWDDSKTQQEFEAFLMRNQAYLI